ncbi:MAG: DUF2971 domain-containing protein [Allomuricauda sp.]
MLVYKYRGGNFERDLEAIEKNYYWAPTFDKLNDPCETFINTEPFKSQTKIVANFLGKAKSSQFEDLQRALHNLFVTKKRGIGIYSLSRTFKDELLWAHYANSHKGFCIEYDLDSLVNNYKSFEAYYFPVKYSRKPPSFTLSDINKTHGDYIVKKIVGFKSKRWGYEKEHRIVTGFYGEQPYEPKCLKSIFFGLNMKNQEKEKMMEMLKGRNIQFFQMVLNQNSYSFDAFKLNDPTKEDNSYMREIPSKITGGRSIRFEILKKEYIREIKAVVEIELEDKVDEKSLKWVANLLREHQFRTAKRIFIFYFLKNDSIREIAWGTSHFSDNMLQVKINDFD